MITKITSNTITKSNYQTVNNSSIAKNSPSFEAQIRISTKDPNYGYAVGMLFDGLYAKLNSLGFTLKGIKANKDTSPSAIIEVPAAFNKALQEIHANMLKQQDFSNRIGFEYVENPSKSLYA